MANLNLNTAILCGRLTADVELKQTQSGISVCSFTLAVNRPYSKDGKQETDFINCMAWRATAEFISKYFKKGSSLCIVGAIQTRSWQDDKGNKRYATEVVVNEAKFVDSKSEGGNAQPSYAETEQPKFEEINTDDDLPF